jgi:hypothetical protein
MRDIYIAWIILKLIIVTLASYVFSAIGSDVVENDSYTARTTSLIREALKCVCRGSRPNGCYPCQNVVNEIRNLRKSIKLINLSKSQSRMTCLCIGWTSIIGDFKIRCYPPPPASLPKCGGGGGSAKFWSRRILWYTLIYAWECASPTLRNGGLFYVTIIFP